MHPEADMQWHLVSLGSYGSIGRSLHISAVVKECVHITVSSGSAVIAQLIKQTGQYYACKVLNKKFLTVSHRIL